MDVILPQFSALAEPPYNIGILVSKIEFGNMKQNDKIQIDISELKSGFYYIILNSRELNVSSYFVKN